MDWSLHYPAYFSGKSDSNTSKRVQFLDIGCGFGGLTSECLLCLHWAHMCDSIRCAAALAEKFPQVLTLGLEIRRILVTHVTNVIRGLREDNADTGKYNNAAGCV
jgi:tRNA (guanine-N7-)-methyltransferase